ncbi:MAG TPA: glycosyltransferase family 2 protein [Phototrophicaceae bacterium]|nr:glycosyltransferase family 2 protein [Phototrophicaceae bacterium]
MQTPLVTVIMPVRNEAEWIARSVGAVLAQDYPPEQVEILLADGCSDDQTVSIVQGLRDASRVRVLANPQRIQSAGLNRALAAASGDVIVRVDGHTVIAPDYLRCCVETLRLTGAECVGGSIEPVGLTTMGRIIAAASKSPFAVPTIFRVSRRSQDVDTVYLGAWPRRVFDAGLRFDENLIANEDYEFNYRLRHAGGHIFFSTELCSEYHGRQSLPALARQYFRYGFWKPKTLIKHPSSLRLRQLAAPALIAFLILCVFLSGLNPTIRVLGLSGAALYLVTNLAFSLSVAWRDNWWMLPRLPLVFLTIHLCWGSGFWLGMFYHLSHVLRCAISAS